MYEKFGQFIDGKWSPSSNGDTYDVINPATTNSDSQEQDLLLKLGISISIKELLCY